MANSPFRVIVVGGGIGGLALGQALMAAGVDVEIHERNRKATDWLQGYRININPSGARALHQCLPGPLWEAFVATSVVSPAGITFRTERLTGLLTLGRDDMTGGSDDPANGQYGVSRVVLRNLLLAGLGDVVRFGATFEHYTVEDDGRITAHFTGGSTATGDVLIGADGANSRVRAQYLPHAERVETDAASIAGRLPLTPQTRSWLPEYLATGMNLVQPPAGRSLFTAAFAGRQQMTEAISHGHDLAGLGLDPGLLLDDLEDYVLWSMIAHHREYPAGAGGMDGPACQKVAGEMVRGWHPALRRMIAETDPATVRPLRFKQSTLVEAWSSSPVTLIGDAVHNMPPVGGLGANTALRDAAELSSPAHRRTRPRRPRSRDRRLRDTDARLRLRRRTRRGAEHETGDLLQPGYPAPGPGVVPAVPGGTGPQGAQLRATRDDSREPRPGPAALKAGSR